MKRGRKTEMQTDGMDNRLTEVCVSLQLLGLNILRRHEIARVMSRSLVIV